MAKMAVPESPYNTTVRNAFKFDKSKILLVTKLNSTVHGQCSFTITRALINVWAYC